MPSSTKSARGDRRALRRAATRTALLQAARRLFGEQGTAATSIQQIADAADVGFGTVFNHFASKEALRDAVMSDMLETFAGMFARLAAAITDPTERLAAFVRITVQTAVRDPEWGWFLVRTSVDVPTFRAVLVDQIAAEVRRVWKGRIADRARPRVVAIAAGGVVLAAIAARLGDQLGADAPEQAAASVLRLADVSPRVADGVVRRPLPRELVTNVARGRR